MNHARLSKSERLQRVLKLLKDRRPHSTMDIIKRAHVCAANSIMAELKQNGINYRCWRDGSVWFYQLRGR